MICNVANGLRPGGAGAGLVGRGMDLMCGVCD